MFEITIDSHTFDSFKDNPSLLYLSPHYLFTFEEQFHIYYWVHRNIFHYNALDQETAFSSHVVDLPYLLKESEYHTLIQPILNSITYTGDRRAVIRNLKPEDFTPETLIDLIFQTIMPAYGYPLRKQQLRMAQEIYSGLSKQSVTLCEAEVGTGKTMAYLVAGLVAKRYNQFLAPYRVSDAITISTSSIELQNAILYKEIPLLSRMLLDHCIIDKPLTAVLRKGKEHYFCLRRFQDFYNTLSTDIDRSSEDLKSLELFYCQDNIPDLDRSRLRPYLKSKICVKGSCSGCLYEETCPYAAFIEYANQPRAFDFQITNHNLFLMAYKASDGYLPRLIMPTRYCILDEAHKLSDAAADVFGVELVFDEISQYLHSIKYLSGNDPVRKKLFKNAWENTLLKARKVITLLDRLEPDSGSGEDTDHFQIYVSRSLQTAINSLINSMDLLVSRDLTGDYYPPASHKILKGKLLSILCADQSLVWISYDKSTRMKSVHAAPISFTEHLNKTVWNAQYLSCALTSGTMQDDHGFDYFKKNLGLDKFEPHELREYSCDSPFNYAQNSRLYISENIPFPNEDDPDYFPAVASEIIKLVHATHGHTAVLFTSYRALNAVFDLVKDKLQEYPLIQMSRSNKNAISDFKESSNGVLFAAGSMWEGVDCAGDILSSVIIVRLPFPLRTQIMEAQKKSCASVSEFVKRFAAPQMIIKLRQGAGRLIRTENDTGILSILDARAAKGGSHRHRVLAALHKYPLVHSIQDIAEFINTVKSPEYKTISKE